VEALLMNGIIFRVMVQMNREIRVELQLEIQTFIKAVVGEVPEVLVEILLVQLVEKEEMVFLPLLAEVVALFFTLLEAAAELLTEVAVAEVAEVLLALVVLVEDIKLAHPLQVMVQQILEVAAVAVAVII
jgi:hypothetical protein